MQLFSILYSFHFLLPVVQIVEPFTAHYVFALGVARFLSCAHWVLQVFPCISIFICYICTCKFSKLIAVSIFGKGNIIIQKRAGARANVFSFFFLFFFFFICFYGLVLLDYECCAYLSMLMLLWLFGVSILNAQTCMITNWR